MAAMPNTPKVFLDANILISAGKPPGGPEITRVRNLVEASLISVVTTDHTLIEVAKHFATHDFEALGDVTTAQVRKLVEQHLGVTIPEVKKADLKAKIRKGYLDQVNAMMASLKASQLSVDDVKASTVLSAYSAGQGFFDHGKKDQFPDAFIFESLKAQASQDQPIIVVSADKDFTKPSADEPFITLASSWSALFDELKLEYQDADIDDWLDEHADDLISLTDEEMDGWGLQGEIEDSEIEESDVTGVKIDRVTAAFKPTTKGDPILVLAEITATTVVTYNHPDWDNASYDSEDGVLIPWDTVSGQKEIDIQIDVSLTISVDEDGNPVKIEEINFRNDDFVWITLQAGMDIYDY
ncbi:PIN domain-containing protein [Brevundimonas sp. G8]|uniref:PIN domain-containing protein n=1 Tax=Brevundimonas sp. G8 TaxID=1350776 RepID=UPI0012EFAE8A|nr:PIN domain-containing protein [Brevundimonas sp. G8]VXB53444.1 conserved hypothetical protein [Brevundimonas sp. G8]